MVLWTGGWRFLEIDFWSSSGLTFVNADIVLARRQMLVRSYPAFPWRHIA